ncbi:Mo-molybdopterin cofactor sulfurase [Operophtera brumata]|uniref:Mo-molybdopterin cofactor sulfurase n=1 Tax=Operophtera brumata TaxID=104452 RepID=A0A0L7LGB1_OPEBR|nr:Mo-molybdopterin cofactor sulfurase [Operophtera brumata]
MKLCVHAYIAAAVTTAGVVGGAYTAYRVYRRFQMTRLPQKWKQVGTLKDIYVYPIKSCGGIMLDRAECTILGLRHGWLRDRVLMVTDEKNNFITARAYPELLTVATSVKNSVLTLSHGDMEPLRVNLAEIIELGIPPKMAQVWSVPVPVYDCGWEASEWISRCLDKSAGNFRLAYYAAHKSRELRGSTNKFYKFTKNDTGALPDEVSFNLINEASVEDLNQKLTDSKVSARNFRPNFVLEGAQAFEEDNYKFVKIGENIFEVIKPCTRLDCTEERRSAGNSPRMGLQMALRSGPGGFVSINDHIYCA